MSLQTGTKERGVGGNEKSPRRAFAVLNQESARGKSKLSRLQLELAGVKEELRLLNERYLGLEEQHSALTTLYVACQRLHSALGRDEVLLTVREIIANLIGCEQYVLFSVAPDGMLQRLDSLGMEPLIPEKLAARLVYIGRVVESREPYLRRESGAGTDEAGLTACIPLRLNGVVIGVMALFSLLPQKCGIQDLDRELFRLLETHLAIALYRTESSERECTPTGVEA